MLAIANADGVVEVPNRSARVLANVLNLENEYVEKALAILEAPDPDSRTPDHEGRRLLRLEDGSGWKCVNQKKYREFRSASHVRQQEQTRKRVAAHRKRKQEQEKERYGNDVTAGSAPKRTEAEADVEAEGRERKAGARPGLTSGQTLAYDFERRYADRLAASPSKNPAYHAAMRTVAAWCDDKAGFEKVGAAVVIGKLLDGFFASSNPKVIDDWGIRFLAQAPLEFYAPKASSRAAASQQDPRMAGDAYQEIV